jgi:Leucine-rich repeat (LRR) protein
MDYTPTQEEKSLLALLLTGEEDNIETAKMTFEHYLKGELGLNNEQEFLNKMGYKKIYADFEQFKHDFLDLDFFYENIPILSNTILKLSCRQNGLKSLPDVLPTKLKILDCSKNLLTSLPVLPKKLRGLDCSGNNIATLPNLPPDMITLNCEFNKLTTLPSPPPNIKIIKCEGNLFPEGYIEEYNKEHPHLSIII